MDDALRRVLVPVLRERGFTGSLPHFRRRASDTISLLSVQHHSSSGSFVVEIAACSPSGHQTSWGKTLEPSRVRAIDINAPRSRLGSAHFPARGDHWFVYGPRSYEEGATTVQPASHYEDVATAVAALIDTEAESFWRSKPHQPEVQP